MGLFADQDAGEQVFAPVVAAVPAELDTVVEPREEPYVPVDDPYRYGWRFVRHEAPDGTVTLEKVPLTLEDLLHPSYDSYAFGLPAPLVEPARRHYEPAGSFGGTYFYRPHRLAGEPREFRP